MQTLNQDLTQKLPHGALSDVARQTETSVQYVSDIAKGCTALRTTTQATIRRLLEKKATEHQKQLNAIAKS